ncbi:MAG: hypothetical protein K6G04_05565 [Lachnospiraceae bacterium]|nr:hypothetical protein [Lachnospiraceae bacterium]
MKSHNKHWSAFDIASMGLMLAIVEVCKHALDFLPNIELVSFLFIVFTLHFGWRILILTWAFSLVECLYFGFGPWTITYFYVWPILIIAVMLLKRFGGEHPLFYATLSGCFGLSFGFLCSLYTLVIGGVGMQITWWISGIPYDLVHCIGNFTICLVLFYPVNQALKRLKF